MKRAGALALGLALLGMTIACSSTQQVECFDCSATRLAITPNDLVTGAGIVAIRVTVSGPSVDSGTLDAIVKGARLRTYPEMVDVPFDAIPYLVTPASSSTESYVEIVPSVTLADSAFFVVSVDQLTGVVPGPTYPVLRAEPGAFVARFGTGAMPVISGISMSETGIVSVGFSESLSVFEATIASQLSVFDASMSPCAYLPPGMPNVPSVRATSAVAYRCQASAYSAKRLHLEFGDPLMTPNGAPLRLLDPKSSTAAGLLRVPSPFDVVFDRPERGRESWSP